MCAVRAAAPSGLGADELVEGSDCVATGDRDRPLVGLPPRDAEPVEGVGEDAVDVGGPVAELVARIGVFLRRAADSLRRPVGASPAVGVNEAANQRSWVDVDQLHLPRLEHDRPCVLHPTAVLRVDAEPVLGRRLDVDAGDVGPTSVKHRGAEHALHRLLDLAHDARVVRAAADAQATTSAAGSDVPVPEILTEKIEVRRRIGRWLLVAAKAANVGGLVRRPEPRLPSIRAVLADVEDATDIAPRKAEFEQVDGEPSGRDVMHAPSSGRDTTVCAGSGTRTRTPFRAEVFETSMSTVPSSRRAGPFSNRADTSSRISGWLGSAAVTTSTPRRVLVAEDEALIRLDLKEMLQEEGYDVVGEAADGEQAVRLAEELMPDLVILDVKMPVLDGISAAERIVSAHIAPVVMLTAFSQRELVERAVDAGAMAYLVKPFAKSDLLPTIEVAVSRHAQLTALEKEVDDLHDRLETRKIVDRAKGKLQADHGMSEPEAFRWIQKTSMDRRTSMRAVADGVVAGTESPAT